MIKDFMLHQTEVKANICIDCIYFAEEEHGHGKLDLDTCVCTCCKSKFYDNCTKPNDSCGYWKNA